MKKSLLILLLCAASTFTGNALSTKDGFYETNIANYITIELQCEYIKPTKVKNGASRSPMQAPTIGFDGRRLYLYGQFSGLTLELLDNGVIVYSAPVEAYANEVVLPDMPGTYELQLCDDMYIYSCEVEIL